MPTRKSRTGRYATVIALAALLLGACASNDADRGDVVDALTEAGVPEEQARCAGRGFEDEFNQAELNNIAEADERNQIPQRLRPQVDSILQECLGQGSGQGSGGESSGTTDPSE